MTSREEHEISILDNASNIRIDVKGAKEGMTSRGEHEISTLDNASYIRIDVKGAKEGMTSREDQHGISTLDNTSNIRIDVKGAKEGMTSREEHEISTLDNASNIRIDVKRAKEVMTSRGEHVISILDNASNIRIDVMGAEEGMSSRGEHEISILDNASNIRIDVKGAKEGMTSRGKHEISILDNASNIRIDVKGAKEEMTSRGKHEISLSKVDAKVPSPAIEPRTEECWIEMMLEKINPMVPTNGPQQPQHFDYEGEPKICNLAQHEDYSQPKAVSIGPFHRIMGMPIVDEDKRSTVNLMKSLYSLNLAGCLKKMKNHIQVARECYSDLDKYKSFDHKNNDVFIEMLMLDGFFILFMLTVSDAYDRMKEQISRDKEKHIHEKLVCNMNGVGNMNRVGNIIPHKDEIMLDFLILDNQIPYFVIELLFNELKLKKTLLNYALDFFRTIHPRSARGCEGHNSPRKFVHLLDLFHWSRAPEEKDSIQALEHLHWTDWTCYTPNATELKDSTTILRKKMSSSSLDFTFQRDWRTSIIGLKINIPSLHIYKDSAFVFHNLIAFEMHCSKQRRFTMAFSTLMWNLLKSEQDAKLLRQLGILAGTSMNDKQLVDLFTDLNKLTRNYRMPINIYKVCQVIQSHHHHRRRQLWGNTIQHYCANPTVAISALAVGMLFIFTLLQTTYAILSHYHS